MNKSEILNTLQMSDPYLGFKKDPNLNSFNGWNSDNSNFQLAREKKTCLEIGSWMGGSAKTLSSIIPTDGDHRAMAVYNDIIESYSLLNPNGIILGDDYTWGTVQEGVNAAIEEIQIGIESRNGQYIINRTE